MVLENGLEVLDMVLPGVEQGFPGRPARQLVAISTEP
jgi:hypothetical protein